MATSGAFYFWPMVLLKVGTGVYVCADEIVLLQTFPSRPARRDKQAAESVGHYKDATTSGSRREPLRTLVHLRCGLLVGSPVTADALAKRSPISSPIKVTTRGNNLNAAQIVNSEVPIENAPQRSPQKARTGEPVAPSSTAPASENLAPSQNLGAPQDEEKPPSRRGLGGFKRLIGRE